MINVAFIVTRVGKLCDVKLYKTVSDQIGFFLYDMSGCQLNDF